MRYPNKSSFGWVHKIRNLSFKVVLLKLLGIYMFINLMFAVLYFLFQVLEKNIVFFDYIYFSFVTSLAIGYGDFVPMTITGKIFIIFHSCISTMYFALMVSILSIKMFYPGDAIKFSKNVVYNSDSDLLIFRVINTNKEALINPEVRISITEHMVGDVSAGVYNLLSDFYITYLGKHDFSYSFKNNFDEFNVINEARKAVEYNKNTNSCNSRFRINISITGNYGLQQIAICKKYYANEILPGKSFEVIDYNNLCKVKKGVVIYSKKFWNDFNKVI